MKSLYRLGVLFVVLGLLITLSATYGFSMISTDRDVALSAAENDSALLAYENVQQNAVTPDSPETVAEFTNNANSSINLTYEISTGNEDVLVDPERNHKVLRESVPVSAGDKEDIALICDPNGSPSGPRDSISITVTVIEAGNGELTIQDLSFEKAVNVDCQGTDNGNNPGNRDNPGNGGPSQM